MTRKFSSTAVQEDLYPPEVETRERESFDESRLADLSVEEESPFLRGQRRIPVRRGSLPKRTASRLKWVVLSLLVLLAAGIIGAKVYRYSQRSWRFRIDSSDQIETVGTEHVTHGQIMEVMGGDIGRNIFFIPLGEQKKQLEQIPWVESASVMRFVPNRLHVEIHERTPVAFVRLGSRISLIDAGGTVMELGPGNKRKYSFPVIVGMSSGEALSTRAVRMKSYNELVRQLDSGGAQYSRELSEVDVNDPEDLKVIVADPNGEVLVHLGASDFLARYKTYVTHVQQWRQQFDKLESVDLRYDGQIIVNPDLEGISRQASLTPAVAKAAMAAGVKPAAIVNYEKYVGPPNPPAPLKKPTKTTAKPASKTTAKGQANKPRPDANAKPRSAATAKSTSPARTAASINPSEKKPAPSTTATALDTKPAKRDSAAVPKPAPVTNATPAASPKKPSAGIPKETSQN